MPLWEWKEIQEMLFKERILTMKKPYIDVDDNGVLIPTPKPSSLRAPNLFKILYSTRFPYKDPSSDEIKYRITPTFIIVKADSVEKAKKLFDTYANGKDWIVDIDQYPESVDLLVDPALTNESSGMSKLVFIQHFEQNVRGYLPNARESIVRNKHMNDVVIGDILPEQKMIDALFVDFVNFVAMRQGVDYAMYTRDLEKEDDG